MRFVDKSHEVDVKRGGNLYAYPLYYTFIRMKSMSCSDSAEGCEGVDNEIM